MIPAGYMYKRVVAAPDWLQTEPDTDVYSVSGCISAHFTDYTPFWRHNGFWLFDSPEVMESVAAEAGVNASALTLLYYELFEQAYEEENRRWVPVVPDPALPTSVRPPDTKRLLGYDVVTFSCGTSPECSPLSCNGLAGPASANRYCLLDTLEEAQRRLESGLFNNSEPGPFRILAVHTVAARENFAA
jgi:hypothetical protein